MGSEPNRLEEDFLEHYGVKGMRWGVRRSRESLAKAREARKNDPNRRVVQERKALKKKVRTLSDGDIQAFTQRLESERKLSTLLKDSTSSPGQRKAEEIVDSIGTKTVKNVGTGIAVSVAAHFGNKFLKSKGITLKLPKLK